MEVSIGDLITSVKADSPYSPEPLLRGCQPSLSTEIRIPCVHPYTSDTLQAFSCGFQSQESRRAVLEEIMRDSKNTARLLPPSFIEGLKTQPDPLFPPFSVKFS